MQQIKKNKLLDPENSQTISHKFEKVSKLLKMRSFVKQIKNNKTYTHTCLLTAFKKGKFNMNEQMMNFFAPFDFQFIHKLGLKMFIYLSSYI